MQDLTWINRAAVVSRPAGVGLSWDAARSKCQPSVCTTSEPLHAGVGGEDRDGLVGGGGRPRSQGP